MSCGLVSGLYHYWQTICGQLSSLTCGVDGEGSAMALRAAVDGDTSIAPDGDRGLASATYTATAVIGEQSNALVWSAGARRLLGYAAQDMAGRPAATTWLAWP